jgi:hypothetical protein
MGRFTMKRILILAAAAVFTLTLAQPVPAQDAASPLVGVWKLKKYERTVLETGVVTLFYGANPSGRSVLTKGGRFSSVGTADGRTQAGKEPTDAERIAHYNSMWMFSGTYRVEGNRLFYTPDVARNPNWVGKMALVQIFKVEGNVLHLETEPFTAIADGAKVTLRTIWEREE